VTFGPLNPFGARRPEPEGEQGDEDILPSFHTHHVMPLTFGGDADDGLISITLPPINWARARRPITPGMPPLCLPPLPAPDVFKLVPPPGVSTALPMTQRPYLTPEERIAFPVAPSPGFAPLAAPPTAPQVTTSPAPTILKPTTGPVPAAIPTPAPPIEAAGEAEMVGKAGAEAEVEVPAHLALRDRVDPLYLLIFYLALSLGTLFVGSLLAVEARYTLLWTALIGLGALLTLVDARHRADQMASGNLVWGLGIGFVIGLPLLILTGPGLAATASVLFPEATLPALFQALVVVGPLGETLFFRGALQEKRGMAASVIGAGAHNMLFFLPAALTGPAYLAGAGIFYLTVLAWAYSYVRRRYGLTAAFLCQATANLMLLVLPSLIAGIGAPPRIP
jgi:membrane protease YdiL (CAAX protease family)